MRKSTVFISAVLTTFALVMLYSVASAYRGNKNATEVATATSAPASTDTLVPTEIALKPEEAAQLAAQIVGNTNLLSAESSNINGVDAYKITFTNKDVVYVGLDGQILSVQVAPVVVNVAPPAKHKNKNNGGGGGGNVSSGTGASNVSGEDNHEEQGD